MSAAAIRILNVGKRYRLGLRAAARRTFGEALVDAALAPWRRLRQLHAGGGPETLWALRDVSFDVQPGEVVGLIGANGAGKSTLLKVLSRITPPTTGEIALRGKVRSLLEVGTGFHPELTGRENIYLNGAILGMKRAEITRHFDAIVAYAEIDRFLDTPVKRYSSGMYVRLAFAVAAHLQPEILIVDEVLAVGDAAFQAKCLGTMGAVARSGRTVLFVSHNMAAVTQLCTRAVVLRGGQVVFDGAVADAIREYRGMPAAQAQVEFPQESGRPAQFRRVWLEDECGTAISEFEYTAGCGIGMEYEVRAWPVGAYVCVAVTNELGLHIAWSADVEDARLLTQVRQPGRHRAVARLPARVLPPGQYTASVAVYAPGAAEPVDFRERVLQFRVRDSQSLLGRFGVRFPAMTATAWEWNTTHVDKSATSRSATNAMAGVA
jgi:lipopolysaccharide transport system ATP-binding protein